MKAIKRTAIVAGVYVALVIAFEVFAVYMGHQDAQDGVAPDDQWILLSTSDGQKTHDTVVAGVEVDGQLYVAANHWPRQWLRRAEKNSDIKVTRAGVTLSHRAIQVLGAERDRVLREYSLPWILRFLTGFPPREFLRLDPVSDPENPGR